jgi:hypothetical protein
MTTFTANEKHWRRRGGQIITRIVAILGCGAAAVLLVTSVTARAAKPDANASRAAFLQLYRVLTSPRCQNCHPAGDAPLQGDDSHVHLQNIIGARTAAGCTGCDAIRAINQRIFRAHICRPAVRSGGCLLPSTRWCLSDARQASFASRLEIRSRMADDPSKTFSATSRTTILSAGVGTQGKAAHCRPSPEPKLRRR